MVLSIGLTLVVLKLGVPGHFEFTPFRGLFVAYLELHICGGLLGFSFHLDYLLW